MLIYYLDKFGVLIKTIFIYRTIWSDLTDKLEFAIVFLIKICYYESRLIYTCRNRKKKNMAKEKSETDLIYESENDSFSKSNTIISSKYKSSLFEQKVFNIILARLQQKKYEEQNNGEELVCAVKASELKHLLGNYGGSFYSQLKSAAASMASRTIGFVNDETEMFRYVSLISCAEYESGIFTVKFNGELKKYISPKTQFTVLELQTILKYKSIYSLRLHELLLSRCYKRKKAGVSKFTTDGTKPDGRHFKIEMDLNELKLCLGVVNAESHIVQKILNGTKVPNYEKAVEKASEKSFNNWCDFKKRVIDTGVKEINKVNNGIHVEYEPLKGGVGARVYGVMFYVDLIGDEETPEVVEEVSEEITEEKEFEVKFQTKSMIKEPLSLKDITAICEAANYDFGKIKNAYDVASNASRIDNLVGFMIKAIKDEYEKPVSKKRKNSFDNFHQREYDYSELEKGLLEATSLKAQNS